MKSIFFYLLLVPVLFLYSCSKDSNNNESITATTLLNVSYGPDPRQKADIYLPANRNDSSTKVLFMIHGGAWSAGDKSDFTAFVDTLKRRLPGYAVVNINYRLAGSGSNLFPTQEMDVKAAIEFIYLNTVLYRVSDKFVLLGASAGAHLAMLHSYKYADPVRIKAVVDFFGPADMTAMYNNPAPLAPPATIAAVIGGTPATHAALYQSSSPVNFIDAQSPPTIILQGGNDPLVLPSQSTAVRDKLTTAGVVNQYVFYPSGGHGDWNLATFTNAFDNIQSFLQANVQ